jgi:hypothetical protein
VAEYTPSLDEGRNAWIEYQTEIPDDGAYLPMSVEEAEAQFDRMIEAVRQEEREKAAQIVERSGGAYPSILARIAARIRAQGKEQGT